MVKLPSKDKKGEEDKTRMYRVLFLNGGKIYEVYARGLFQSDLYGFIEIEDYVFGGRSNVVIDPQEDKLRNEFEGVTRSYIPYPVHFARRRSGEGRGCEGFRKYGRISDAFSDACAEERESILSLTSVPDLLNSTDWSGVLKNVLG